MDIPTREIFKIEVARLDDGYVVLNTLDGGIVETEAVADWESLESVISAIVYTWKPAQNETT